jgi:hypothetical protein
MVHHKMMGKLLRKLTRDEFATVSRYIHKTSKKKLIKEHHKLMGGLYVVVPEEVAIGKVKQSFQRQLRLVADEEKDLAPGGLT